MSMDNRNTSALFKRAEQLKRWEESETNKHSGTPKSPSMRRIKFSSGCIFLAACVAGDKEEVSRLLEAGADIDTANVDGLTALHQACIDDNLDMVEFLVQNGADVNRKDNEGWTPLHATSSCGFLSIARYLIENGADLASINSDGELALDLACSDAMEDLIQRHIDEQGIDCEDARQAEEKIMLSDAKRWLRSDSTDCDKPHPKTGATALHVAAAKGYSKVLGLLLDGRGDFDKQDADGWTPLHAAAYWGQKEAVQMLLNANVDIDIQNYSGQYPIDIAQKDIVPLLDEARKNIKRPKRRPASQIRITDTIENSIETPTKVIRVEVKPIDSKEKEEVPEKENQPTEPDVILRRTQSFESDEKFYQKYVELRARIQANSCPILPNTNAANAKTAASNYLVQRSASLKDHRTLRKATSNLVLGSTGSTTGPATTNVQTTTPTATSPPTSPTGTPTTTPSAGQIRRSFVPPTRDEESETQRKAHAKRVRETRRSTQGVTLDEIKSAEQLVKKKNSTNSDFKLEDASAATNTPAASTNTTSSTITALDSSNNRQQNEMNSISMSSLAQRRQNGDSSNLNASRPTSAPELSSSNTVSSQQQQQPQQNDASLHLRRPTKTSEENKENDKENENRSSAQATQAVIQRRRRPKRRSTGVVHVDMEDIDPERQDSPVDGEEKESGAERGRSRVGSTASELADQKDAESKENGGDYIDYKALYEQAKADNDMLKGTLRKKDEEVLSLKAALDRFTTATTKNNSLSELEKRERRAMERKMSEMEEELKQLEALKTENQRLKDENGALIRVISKLSR